MSELEKLHADKAKIQSQIWDIEQAETAKINKKLLGKCFRYWDTFGSGGDGWWLYAKVIDVDAGNPIAHRFQIDANGGMEIEPRHVLWHDLSSGYDKISNAAFDAAWTDFKAAIGSITP